ncbi:MAG TPA: septum formation family protein [Candidatus Limnocylindrales bacterium]|jgi:hypothetical protein
MKFLSGIGVRIAIIAVIVVVAFVLRDRLSGSASDLRVGDCFQDPGAIQEISDVQHTPCTDPHDNEVVFAAEHPAAKGAAALSDDQWGAWAAQNCLPAFLSYTGQDLLSQEVLDIGWFVPTDEAWADGSRKAICYAYRIDLAKLTQSVKKTN